MRTDRGGEFTSLDFNDFCQQHGIKRQLTTAYTPQQNGVAERKNRTIMNMVRAMLLEKGIPKPLWAEAVNWSNYVLNRCPTSMVENVTPAEAWNGNKPAVEHFRVFGCIAHAHVPEVKRTKLDCRSVKCVFVGVSEESKGYRLFNPVMKKVIVSRDVIFEEEKQWDWEGDFKEQTSVHLEWGDDSDKEEAYEDGGDEIENEGDAGIEGDGEIGNLGNMRSGDCAGESSRNAESAEIENAVETVEGVGLRRARKTPAWMTDFVSGEDSGSDDDDEVHLALHMAEDPMQYEDAVAVAKWKSAMDDEMNSITKNKTWTLVQLPVGSKKIGVKWVYKTKYNELGGLEKHKARLVAKGYTQKHGIDYTEVYAPVARMETVRMIAAIAAQRNWNIFQLDMKSAFLHGELNEEVYVEQPKGYEIKGSEEKVYRLHKALYGLKQAPRA